MRTQESVAVPAEVRALAPSYNPRMTEPASPPTEQLPAPDPATLVGERLVVADRPTWIVLGGLLLAAAAALGWILFGSVPVTVGGHGMILPDGGFREVGVEVAGLVETIGVEPGSEVRAGEEIATIREGTGVLRVLTSPVDGRVASVLVRGGAYTTAGTGIATIEPTGAPLVYTGFVPARDSRAVEPGMQALIDLGGVPVAQWGSLRGSVLAVAPLPVAEERALLLVGGNRALVEDLLAAGPVVEVTVGLVRDPAAPSGYAWTSGAGPAIAVRAGIVAALRVVVAGERPIDLITP